jgi:hypothetical protein
MNKGITRMKGLVEKSLTMTECSGIISQFKIMGRINSEVRLKKYVP